MLHLGQQQPHFGLIHGDPGFRNFVYHEGQARLLDFDEFGRGYYAHDLAEPLRIMLGWDNYPTLREALLKAYEQEEPLPLGDESQLDVFIAATLVSYLNWGFCMAGEADYQEFLKWVPSTLARMSQLCRF